mgnify:CR=1 FL=1
MDCRFTLLSPSRLSASTLETPEVVTLETTLAAASAFTLAFPMVAAFLS